jgi:poly-gamma-glutamate synthesis protein (capsule biosynthesis protein)
MTAKLRLTRRTLIAGAPAALIVRRAAAQERTLTLALLGQALIQHDLRTQPYPDLARFAALIGRADAGFTDLETAIRGPHAGTPTREGVFVHIADPAVLDCLKALNIGMLALSNNHAFDLNSGGILDMVEAARTRGFTAAGAGADLPAAAAPAYRDTPGGRIGLVSVATGQIREGGAATAQRPGVNEIRRRDGVLDADDVARAMAAIGAAARGADLAIFYHHNHYWERDDRVTPEWQKALAHQAIDAGAGVFVSHGVPRMHGIEIYRGRPIFYSLGSFVFQTATPLGAYAPDVWQSTLATCRFSGGRLRDIELAPVQLNEQGVSTALHLETRGRPSLAAGDDAAAILAHVAELSRPYGTAIAIADGIGRIAA